jgi:hypothetical protein
MEFIIHVESLPPIAKHTGCTKDSKYAKEIDYIIQSKEIDSKYAKEIDDIIQSKGGLGVFIAEIAM